MEIRSAAGRILLFALAGGPIASLFLYFWGLSSMPSAVRFLVLPAIAGVFGVWAVSRLRNWFDLSSRIERGLWAGSFATLIYDLVRLPLAHFGIPIFKANSYFGTVILGTGHPTFASEVVGWGFHFATGVGFGLMYFLIVGEPELISAVGWGIALEVAMLLTPYAEVFGYRRSAGFLAATLSAHVFYGLGLWWFGRPPRRHSHVGPRSWALPARALTVWALCPLVIGAIAADF